MMVHLTLTLYVGVEGHVQHSPTQGVGCGLCAGDNELPHGIDEVLISKRTPGISCVLLQLVQIGINIVPWCMGHPALGKSYYNLLQEVVHLSSIVEQLLVFSKGQIFNPRKGVVEESPAADSQLHVLTEDLNHMLEVAVIVGETLAEDDQIGDV